MRMIWVRVSVKIRSWRSRLGPQRMLKGETPGGCRNFHAVLGFQIQAGHPLFTAGNHLKHRQRYGEDWIRRLWITRIELYTPGSLLGLSCSYLVFTHPCNPSLLCIPFSPQYINIDAYVRWRNLPESQTEPIQPRGSPSKNPSQHRTVEKRRTNLAKRNDARCSVTWLHLASVASRVPAISPSAILFAIQMYERWVNREREGENKKKYGKRRFAPVRERQVKRMM